MFPHALVRPSFSCTSGHNSSLLTYESNTTHRCIPLIQLTPEYINFLQFQWNNQFLQLIWSTVGISDTILLCHLHVYTIRSWARPYNTPWWPKSCQLLHNCTNHIWKG